MNKIQNTTQNQPPSSTTTTTRVKDKDIVEQNRKLGALHRQKNLSEAEAMFNTMRETNRFDIDSFNMMMDLYEELNLTGKMLQLFKDLTNLGLKPDDRTYGPILRSHNKSSNFNNAINLWNTMIQQQVPISLQNVRMAMLAFYKSHRYEDVISMYKYMQEGNFYDQAMYSHLIDSLSRCGKTDEVHKMYQEMISRGIKPDIKCFYAVFATLTFQAPDREKYEYYKKELESYHIKENGMLYMFDLQYFAKLKDFVGVMDTLIKIESNPSVKMTETFVKIIVDSIGNCDRPQDMVNYISSIEGAGVPPYVGVYATVIDHLNRLVSPQSAIQMYNIAIHHKKLTPTIELRNIMLKVYTKDKDKEGLKSILEQFSKLNKAPDATLLKAAMEVLEGK